MIPPILAAAFHLAALIVARAITWAAQAIIWALDTYVSAAGTFGRALLHLLGVLARPFLPPIIPLPRQRRALSNVVGTVALALVILLSGMGIGVAYQITRPSPKDILFGQMLSLAYKADAAHDAESALVAWTPEKATGRAFAEPQSAFEALMLRQAIVKQIEEETGIPPRFVDYGLWHDWVNSPVGIYDPWFDIVGLNSRYLFDAGWRNNDQSYLFTFAHELVHSQGVWVGESHELEAQTETVTYEVMAALANRNWPYARVSLFNNIRRDALLVAFWLANGLDPVYSVYERNLVPRVTPDEGKLGAWREARAAIFTTTERSVHDKLLRWWFDKKGGGGLYNYLGVLRRYVLPVLLPLTLYACTEAPVLRDRFQYYERTSGWGQEDMWLLMFSLPPKNVEVHQYVLTVDDFGYIMKGLGAC